MLKQKKVTVNEKEYMLQNPGSRWYFDNFEICTVEGKPQQSLIYKSYLEHVVVDPQLTIEDFAKEKGTSKSIKLHGESFVIKHPGIERFLDIVSEYTNLNGLTNVSKQQELYMELITYKNKKVTYEIIDELDNGFSILQSLVKECQKFSLEGKGGELNSIIAACENFLRSGK